MISKPMLTKAWRAAAKSGDEFIAAVNYASLRTYWYYALAVAFERGILVVTRYGKPVGVVGSPMLLRDIFTEWRDRQSSTCHLQVRQLLEETIAGIPFHRLEFLTVEVGIKSVKSENLTKLLRVRKRISSRPVILKERLLQITPRIGFEKATERKASRYSVWSTLSGE